MRRYPTATIAAAVALALALLLCGAAAPRARADAREKLDVVLLLDNSGSMHAEGRTPGNDERFMRVTAVQYLLQKMAPGDRAAVVTFDTTAHTDPDASRLRDPTTPGAADALYRGLRRIAARPNGSTNMAAGLRAAAALLPEAQPGRRRFIVLLTDGTPNPARGDNTPEALVRYADALGRRGIALFTVGLGALSEDPRQAATAGRLLEDLARVGRGIAHRAARAEDLPPLFGALFAQLVGHEVSRTVQPGQEAAVTLAPGTRNLRVVAVSEGAPPAIRLLAPDGRAVEARPVPPALGAAQSATVAVAPVNSPAAGTWRVRADRGALEVAFEPNFEAALVAPAHNSPVPAAAPVALTVEIRRTGESAPMKLTGGRVVVEYEQADGSSPAHVDLAESKQTPGRFTGTLPDSGAVGPHRLTVRCFRQGDNGEEEGGPAYAVLQVGRIPVLELLDPAEGASFTLPLPIAIRARVRVAGEPVASIAAADGLSVRAVLVGTDRLQSAAALRPAGPPGSGAFAAELITTMGPGARPGPVALRVTLAGRFEGAEVAPQTIERTLTLTPRPVVQVRWAVHPGPRDPDDALAATAYVRSSSARPETLLLRAGGDLRPTLAPDRIAVPPNQPERAMPVRLRWRGAAPGAHNATVAASLDAAPDDPAALEAAPLEARVRIRDWLERNRLWLFPALALGFLAVATALLLAAHLAKEKARQTRMKLNVLNGVRVKLSREDVFAPPQQTVLGRDHFTFGGPGSDKEMRYGQDPGTPVFEEPRMRVTAFWDRRARKARVRVNSAGTGTMFIDREGHIITGPIVPTEGGERFIIAPENVEVMVTSTWTL